MHVYRKNYFHSNKSIFISFNSSYSRRTKNETKKRNKKTKQIIHKKKKEKQNKMKYKKRFEEAKTKM